MATRGGGGIMQLGRSRGREPGRPGLTGKLHAAGLKASGQTKNCS